MRTALTRRSPQPRPAHRGDSNTSRVAEYAKSLSIARDLIEAGIPVFVAKPATNAER